MPLIDPPPEIIPPWDLHILRGQGPVRLGRMLQVNWSDASGTRDNGNVDDVGSRHNDFQMRFRPTFNYSIAGDTYVGFGIILNALTGELTANDWPASSHTPANFIVEVTVANNGTGPVPWHFPVVLLRVHVHRHVDRIWLTPRRLWVRRSDVGESNNTSSAFTVRARFDDGVVGDITYSDQLTMLPADHFTRWSNGAQYIQLPSTAADGTTVNVTAVTSAAWGSQQAQGEIQILTPWAIETDYPRAEWIDGDPRVLAGTRPPEDLPNVLFVNCGFLSDGSVDDESAAFVKITDFAVKQMKTEPMFQPFGYLSGSINYWRLIVRGQSSGISVRCEVFAALRDGQLFAWPVPASDLPIGSGQWTLENLIYMAGLPIRSDLALVRNMDTNQPITSVADLQNVDAERLDFAQLTQKWTAIMQPTPARNVLKKVAGQWLALAERTFIDEVNNFPATVLGTPPSASSEFNNMLTYDNLRGGVDDFTLYMLDHVTAAPRGNSAPIAIQNPPNRTFGDLWRSYLYAFRNRQFMVALSNVPYGRAQATTSGVHTRLYLASQDQKGEMPGLPVDPVVDRSSLALARLPATRIIRADTWRTIVHELGHSFGLGDEYTEFAATFSGTESDLNEYANLTTPQTFLNQDGTLNLAQIKWNWHRIRFASVINQIARVGTTRRFELHVRPQPVPWFIKNDIVLLRGRQKMTVINRATPVSAPYIIDSVSDAGDVLIVAPTTANADLAGFAPGSIVYKPVPGPNSGQYMRLISPAAERIMQIAIKGTMTGAVCNVSDQMSRNRPSQAPLKDDPLGHVSSKNLPSLIGAHFGGKRDACGVVHPSGHCMMRTSSEDTSSFCHVCRYVLVEQIDPEQHWLIDGNYEKQYPR